MGTHHHTTIMEGTKIKRVTFLLAAFSSATYGQNRVNPNDAECFYDYKCTYGDSDTPQEIDVLTYATFDDQVVACYELCKADADGGGSCAHFTLFTANRVPPTCYLLDTCNEDPDSACVGNDRCRSGPSDCDNLDANAPCTTIDASKTATGAIHWQCTDGDGSPINGYTVSELPEGSTCVLSCEYWETATGENAYLTSECQRGSWTTTTSNGDPELDFPAFAAGDTEYKTPEDDQTLVCGCRPLEVKWPYEDPDPADDSDQWWYDPNFELGTDFVCEQTIDTADAEYIIENGNQCYLFCDDHLVADVHCKDGEWTGQPELGFWCYNEPVKGNELTTEAPPF